MRRMSRTGQAVLLGIWMLCGGNALAESPAAPEDLTCKGECKQELETCIQACKERCNKLILSCAMAAGICSGDCRNKCELSVKGKK